jgi:hypothetical protein
MRLRDRLRVEDEVGPMEELKKNIAGQQLLPIAACCCLLAAKHATGLDPATSSAGIKDETT